MNFYPVKEWELYDNEQDPLQLRSVYADPAYASTVSELKAELERLRQLYESDFDPQATEQQPAGVKKPKAARQKQGVQP